MSEKSTQEDLEQKQKELEDIINAGPDGADIVDENLRIVWMNKKFHKIFGDNAIGKKCYEVYKDNHLQCDDCPLKEHHKIMGPSSIEVEGVAGGKIYEIRHANINHEGKMLIFEQFRDITEQKTGEKKLAKTMKELKDRVGELERFTKIAVGREAKMIELKKELEDSKDTNRKNSNE